MRCLLYTSGIATFKESEKRFYFKNGSSIIFGYCATEGDVLQYQGQEYDVIFIDEATQFTEFQFSTLTACLRGANDFPKRMYLTCNPGGVGHAWVKRLFVDRESVSYTHLLRNCCQRVLYGMTIRLRWCFYATF